ncbi:MAG TPA: HAMP domain-containing sensor histidine kinase [Spirochaetia bacterium]|nr:HAMP domain-containing sensor histidine kinase [Spirochaetia bacterium]
MRKPRLLSILAALLSFIALSGVNALVFRGLSDARRLLSRNDLEQTVSALFAGLRLQPDFGSVIVTTPGLATSVLGVAVYGREGALLYRWGEPPSPYVAAPSTGGDVRADMERTYLENARNGSVILLLRPPGDAPPPPREGDTHAPRGSSFMSDVLGKAGLIYLEVRQPRYWSWVRLRVVLIPATEAALAALVFFVRLLVVRNREYRRRIEQQESLVTLGTAASTLAHEIKNPLLSIRLQASILARTMPGGAKREIEIIESEVERLSQLSNRVGDFLRDPAGIPARTDVLAVAAEVHVRMRGKPLIGAEAAGAEAAGAAYTGVIAMIDPERLRSVVENLLRNALESGGKDEDVAITVAHADGEVRIDVLDRGRGLPEEQPERVFDPFFTTKSRGTGIGLAICRKFVTAAGGTITVSGREDGGVRARIVLPQATT